MFFSPKLIEIITEYWQREIESEYESVKTRNPDFFLTEISIFISYSKYIRHPILFHSFCPWKTWNRFFSKKIRKFSKEEKNQFLPI